jgi:hypothetical protein
MLTVWGRRSSFNLQKVMWLIGELGIEHLHIEAGGQFGGLDTREFRAMNPHGRVPVIDDNGTMCGNRTRSCATWPHAMDVVLSGAMTMRHARSRIDGWIGLKHRFSPTFWSVYFGGSIGPRTRKKFSCYQGADRPMRTALPTFGPIACGPNIHIR